MTTRESWEQVSFQVFTDENGVLRSGFYPTGEGLVTGNVQVDRVWGNMPMQPDDDRTDNTYSFGGGDGDRGWAPTYTYSSDTLRINDYSVEVNNVGLEYKTPADSHNIAADNYSGYPEFTTVPRVVGDSLDGATTKIEAAGLTVDSVVVTTAGATKMNDGTVKSQSPRGGDGVTGSTSVDLVLFDVSGVINTVVPNIVGLVATAANAALTSASLTTGTVTTTATGANATNSGKVKTQAIAAETVVDSGTAVGYVLYDFTTTVPDIVGLTATAANAALTSASLTAGTVTTTATGATEVNDGTVASQNPAADASVLKNTAVNYVLYAYTP